MSYLKPVDFGIYEYTTMLYISCSDLPLLLEEHYTCSPGVYFC